MDYSWLQWVQLAVGAALVGLSKTGIPGIGALAVAMLSLAIGARPSVGFVLPLLIVGDVVAVASYRAHASWPNLLRIFPWTIAGVVAGWLLFARIDARQTGILVGSILLAMVGLHAWRRFQPRSAESREAVTAHSWAYVIAMGLLAGFTTMVANAAGPVMTLFLLASGLPKLQFVGTAAWFFLILNLSKVPFSAQLGILTADSLLMNALLAPLVVVGGLAGRWLLPRIRQDWFEGVALGGTLLAGIKLIVG